MLAPDADVPPKAGWWVDTSGTPAPFRLGPHLDTRFVGFLVGFQLRVL